MICEWGDMAQKEMKRRNYRDRRKLLKMMNMFTVLFVVMVSQKYAMLQPIRLYTLKIYAVDVMSIVFQ